MPTALPSDDAARLATDLLDVLPDTATIMRATSTPDGVGNRTLTWATLATSPCRLDADPKMTGAEKVVAERFRNTQIWELCFPAGTDVQITDRVEVFGLLLSVESIVAPRSIEIERLALCVEAVA